MNDMDDCQLAGAFIKAEHMYQYPTITKFREAIGTSHPTLHKIHMGNFAVRPQVIIGIERALRWPYGTIAAMRAHDLNWLRANDLPADTLQRFTDALNQNHGDQEATA